MLVKEEMIDNEMKLWEKFYNNYDNLAKSVLADVLAHYKKEDRANLIKGVEDILEQVKEPINGELMYESIKGDLESFGRLNDESAVAYRTLSWIKEIADKSKMSNAETEISSEETGE